VWKGDTVRARADLPDMDEAVLEILKPRSG